MKKRILTYAMALLFAFVFIPAVAAYAGIDDEEIVVRIDGSTVNFDGQNPAIVDGRTLVPVRGVFEGLGFDVNWNPDTRQVTLTRTNDIIVTTIGSSTFVTNGTDHLLDTPAQIIGGSTMLPIRAMLESVGYRVDWNGEHNTVSITSTSLSSPELFAAMEVSEVTAGFPLQLISPPRSAGGLSAFIRFYNQQGNRINYINLMQHVYEQAGPDASVFTVETAGVMESDLFHFSSDSYTPPLLFLSINDLTPRTIEITVTYTLDPSIYVVASITISN